MAQIFYELETGQVMAVYKGCKHGGTKWRERGFVEAECPDDIPVSRDHKVTVRDGVAISAEASPNPEQPVRAREPGELEVLMEAARAAGLDIDAAREKLRGRSN